MNKFFSKFIIFSSLVLLLLIIKPVFAYNFVNESGLGKSANVAGYSTTGVPNIDIVIGNTIKVILSFVGVIFLLLVIYGSITWMTAEGNDAKVKKAKAIITDSIIGLALTLSAYAITYFVLNYFWG